MLRLRCRKRDWKKKDAYLTSINMINEDERWKSIESIDVKIRMQKERCLPSTFTSINMINEDERWKSIENIDVKMQKERLEKERERKRVIAEAGPLNTFIMRTLLIS